MEEQNVAIRLKGFIDSLGINYSRFAENCGLPKPTLSQLLNGRNKKISDVVVGQIHHAYPDLSVLWLLFGEGPMIVPVPAPAEFKTSLFGEEDADTPENASQDSDFPTNHTGSSESSNVRALTTDAKAIEVLESKLVEYQTKVSRLQMQIDNLRNNPRKVTQIMVYYEDSTFEVFVPYSDSRKESPDPAC